MADISGGAKLAAYLKKWVDATAGGPYVKVGFLAGAAYPDGTPVAAVAAFNEFGGRDRPPRPFFRNMVAQRGSTWGAATATALKTSGNDVNKALDLVGQGIKGQLQQSIVDLTDPPLAASTVRAKGFDKPLISTGHMLNSVDYEVVG
jgi:hypothetical protein